MKLGFFNADEQAVETDLNLRHYPTLDMSEEEASTRRSQEVLHLRVTRPDGTVAHFHFAVGLNNKGRVFGEVTAITSFLKKQTVRKVFASWLLPWKKRPEGRK